MAATAIAASAQSVRWQVAGGYFARGQNSDLVLIFDNCEPSGDIVLPPMPGLQVGQPTRGERSSQTIINGNVTTQTLVYFSYPALAQSDGLVRIPAFSIGTNKGTVTVPAVQYESREATIGDANIPISQVAQSQLAIDSGQFWAGEVVPVTYSLDVSARFRANLGGAPEWSSSPLVVEEWLEPTRATSGTGGAQRNVLSYVTRGYIKNPGSYVVPSVRQLVNIGIPTAGIFQSLRAEQYSITSDSPRIEVKPLPAPAPPSFEGAVGEFELVSTVVPEQSAVGEPVTWTLELRGNGNWPDITRLPTRQVAQSFRVVQPEARREIPEGKLFEGIITEDVVLIPTQAGEFSLGPVEWTFFDPVTESYQTLTAAAKTLSISPAAIVSTNPSLGATTSAPDIPAGPLPINAAPAPDSPSTLMLEVLPGTGSSLTPLNFPGLIRVGAILLAIFPILWICFSWSRARKLDSGKPARQARGRLAKTIQRIEMSGGADLDEALALWRKDAAILWRSDHAAPSEEIFSRDEIWTALWDESDRRLYADGVELPSDWTERAQRALAQKKAPSFPILSVLAPRHLFPVLVVLLSLGTGGDLNAQGEQAYRQAEFAEAEQIWRDAIAAEPTDWIAHHNLALALAQQDRWDEAGAHATIAFVQNPRHPSTRWHLNYTLERSGYTPPVIGRFLTPDCPEKIAREASSAEWQVLLLGGLLLLVVEGILILVGTYYRRIPGHSFLISLGALVAVALMAGASFGLQVWSTTKNADAALTWQAGELRSIPTDLNAEQETTRLAAGSLCIIEKSFLGWRQVSFPNGQTGWIRKEALVPLWDRAP